MRKRPQARFAFIGWNSFQLSHALDIARGLEGSVLVVERRPEHGRELSEAFLTGAGVPVLFWEPERFASLDGHFDVVVCQSVFPQIERFEKSRIAMLQYGLAKEPHNYGAWRALADLCLVYGPYSARKISYFCPVAQVGNPRLDRWGTSELAAEVEARYNNRLDPRVPTLLYVPTWGDLSTQDAFLAHIIALSDRYNVLIKLHHNTALLEPHRGRIAEGARVHDVSEDDLLPLFSVADVVLSDYSGAIFDALYCEKRVVLLQSARGLGHAAKLDEHSLEYAARERIGPVVEEPERLAGVVERVLRGEVSFQTQNRELVQDLYVPGPGSTARAVEALRRLAAGDAPARSQLQAYVREEIRAARLNRFSLRLPNFVRGRASERRDDAHVKDFERELLESWLRAGHARRVLRYADLRLRVLPRVYLYRVAIRAAQALGDQARVDDVLKRARADFPQAHFGDAVAVARPRAPARAEGDDDRAKARAWRLPYAAYGRIGVAYAFSRTGHVERAERLLKGLSGHVPVERDLLLATILRKKKDDEGAYHAALLAQREQPGDARVLMRIADALRDDAQYDRAHVFFRLAAEVDPLHGAVRLLNFESDMGWFEFGRATLSRLLESAPSSLSSVLANLNRATVHYPEFRAQLKEVRHEARRSTRRVYPSPRALQRALDNRWLDDVLTLRAKAPPLGPLATRARRRADAVLRDLGALAEWVELAWRNEHEDELVAVCSGGRTEPVRAKVSHGPQLVEFFIPTPFFAHNDTEKVTYATVRSAFRALFGALAARDDVRIVPRLQLNWRNAAPRTTGRVISYHTRGPHDGRRLHIQEAPLAGFVSLDPQGYAGFARVATDPAWVEQRTKGVSEGALEANYRALQRAYVAGRVSKYPQPASAEKVQAPYVFVPLQLVTDEVSQLAHMNGLELLRAVIRAYEGTSVKVVVKRHPYCRSMGVQRALAEHVARGEIVLSSGSVHALIEGASAVYCVNSGVGLEALLREKPVIVAGQCDYAWAAWTVRDPSELREAVERGVAFDREQTLRFFYAYRHGYLLDPRDEGAVACALAAWLENRPIETVSGAGVTRTS